MHQPVVRQLLYPTSFVTHQLLPCSSAVLESNTRNAVEQTAPGFLAPTALTTCDTTCLFFRISSPSPHLAMDHNNLEAVSALQSVVFSWPPQTRSERKACDVKGVFGVAEPPAHGVSNCSSGTISLGLWGPAWAWGYLRLVPMLIAALPRASSGNLAKASASPLAEMQAISGSDFSVPGVGFMMVQAGFVVLQGDGLGLFGSRRGRRGRCVLCTVSHE